MSEWLEEIKKKIDLYDDLYSTEYFRLEEKFDPKDLLGLIEEIVEKVAQLITKVSELEKRIEKLEKAIK